MRPDSQLIDRACRTAVDIAERAGDLLRRGFDSTPRTEWKQDGSPVTETDLAIDRLVERTLAEAFPNHGYLGEETGRRSSSSTYTWVCDPIDGTRPFVLGFPLSTVSLALVRDGEPIVAVLAYPARRWLFVAEKGAGATLNGERLTVSSTSELAGAVIDVCCAARLGLHVPGAYDALDELGAVPTSYGSAAVTAAAVARGAFAGSLFSGTNPWDAAAVKLIVEEAGGRFTDLDGGAQRYDGAIRGFVASNGRVHDELLDIVRRCGVRPGRAAPQA